jgi:hypothetical protein
MTTLDEIETALSRLPEGDLARFRRWFAEFDGRRWDEQIEEDVRSGV